ncbi:putative outer membrane starch-binding protein [Dinghuibacter silviterrae]|uniref:Putative outer membrane starch-binding protein n=2 Tax=Dinghuibacter silviterrae TaxID=1539049 RepID=A0A4R8DH88_9BACT|nr:putative outer membrane starch-binding protein [Dinghuibacter silviterrae]
MGACKKNGYLSSTVTSNLDSNAVFQDSTYAMEFLNNLYVNIGFATDPMRFNGGSYAAGLESACDEAEGPNASSSNGFTMFALGTVTPTVVPTDAWGTSYGMIRAANQYLRHLGIIPFNAQLKAETKGEARFLRAWYYFILLEHYGGIPLIGDTVYADATQISAVRSSFRACVNYIASECDSAAVALPLTQSGSNYGRASKGACLALKSRLYLYAASPLFQNGGIGQGTALDSIVAYPDADPSRWVLAANAAQAVITTGAYSLFVDSIPGKLGYGFMSIFLQRYNTEYILAHMMDPNRYLEHLWDAPSRGGSGGPHPYQELLDAFPMSNGLAITDPNSGYDPSQPYQNRDPRMGYTYMHDSTLRPQVGTNAPSPLEIYLNANVSPPVASSQDAVYQGTPTGYYINKMIDTGVIQINIPTSSRVLPLIRYAEILLNYAEATNESQGPVTTVYQAVEAIRQRAGLRPYQLPTNLSQADMRKAIQNERRIELAFEGNRFFDVRRWMIADSTDNQMMHGMEIDRSSSGTVYKEFNVRQHHFSKAMYLWPLPLSEIAKLPQLQQNPLY